MTEIQPAVGVAMILIWPGRAVIAPGVVEVAVTVIFPPFGITTEGGSAHRCPLASLANPLVTVA